MLDDQDQGFAFLPAQGIGVCCVQVRGRDVMRRDRVLSTQEVVRLVPLPQSLVRGVQRLRLLLD